MQVADRARCGGHTDPARGDDDREHHAGGLSRALRADGALSRDVGECPSDPETKRGNREDEDVDGPAAQR